MKKYLLILTTLALLGGGCSKEEIPETTDGEGSVEFRTTTCSEVDSQTTRAQTSLPDNCKPSGNSFKLVVKGKEGTATAEYLAEYTTLSEYTAPFMPSGDYTATISYGDPQQEGSTAFCYQGALDFTILARKTIQKTITASLTNSVISLECGEWFKKYYSEAQFTVQTEAGNNFSFTPSSSPDTPIFVKPGSKLLLKGTAVKAQNGVKVEFPQQQIGVTTARTWHKIRIDASQAGQGSISIRLDDTLTEVPPQEIELNPEA